MRVNLKECRAAGLNAKKVEALAKRISELGVEAEHLGLTIFGCGEGSLRQRQGDHPLIVAYLDGYFDGGAGDPMRNSPDGLIRGE